jgi:hypothetical protein
MTPPLDPDSYDARGMLTDATRDLVLDILAEVDLEEMATDALKQLVSVLKQAAERHANEGLPPVAYEDSLAAHIERRRRQRDIDA